MQRRAIKMHVAIFLPWRAIKTGLLIDESVAENPSTSAPTYPGSIPQGRRGERGICSPTCDRFRPRCPRRLHCGRGQRIAQQSGNSWRDLFAGRHLRRPAIRPDPRSRAYVDAPDTRDPRLPIPICAHRYDTVAAISRDLTSPRWARRHVPSLVAQFNSAARNNPDSVTSARTRVARDDLPSLPSAFLPSFAKGRNREREREREITEK